METFEAVEVIPRKVGFVFSVRVRGTGSRALGVEAAPADCRTAGATLRYDRRRECGRAAGGFDDADQGLDPVAVHAR